MKTGRAVGGQRKVPARRAARGVTAVERPIAPRPTAKPAPAARNVAGGARGAPKSSVASPGTPQPASRVRRRSRWHAVWASGQAVALLGALLCGGALAYLLTTSDVNVQAVVIGATGLSTPEEVAAAGGVTGHNLFTVDPQVVAERLIALPTVREAQVWGELPNRLVIQVTERQPALLWQVNADRYLLDDSGHVLAVNPSPERQQQLVRVISRDTSAIQVGGQIAIAPVQTALTITRRAAEVSLPIAGIEYAPTSGIVIIVNDNQGVGRQIIIGGDTRLEDKVAAAAEVYRTMPTWTVLNVTDPDRPFFPAR